MYAIPAADSYLPAELDRLLLPPLQHLGLRCPHSETDKPTHRLPAVYGRVPRRLRPCSQHERGRRRRRAEEEEEEDMACSQHDKGRQRAEAEAEEMEEMEEEQEEQQEEDSGLGWRGAAGSTPGRVGNHRHRLSGTRRPGSSARTAETRPVHRTTTCLASQLQQGFFIGIIAAVGHGSRSCPSILQPQ